MARRPKTSKSALADKIRVKLLADLDEGKSETIVVVPAKRVEELFGAGQARRAQLGDFAFNTKAA